MIPYASWTGTKANLSALRGAGWRVLTGPPILARNAWARPRWDDGSPAPFALDNGAWTAHQQDRPFDSDAFSRSADAVGEQADWIVVPDIVAGGLESLEFSVSWFDRLRRYRLLLLAVQDGMSPDDVRPILSSRIGLFLGGSTEWKLSTMHQWGQLTREVGSYYHIGRVNTVRRIYWCNDAGADSFDGTSVTRFSCNLSRLDNARRQLAIFQEKP